MSGAHAFNFYTVSIFRASFTGIDPHGAAALVAFVQLLASITSGLLVDTIGRLPLLIASNLFITLSALSSTWKAAPWPIQRRNSLIDLIVGQASLTYTYINRGGIILFSLASLVP